MDDETPDRVDEWAREFAEHADVWGVGVLLIDHEPDGKDRTKIRYLFDRLKEFDVCKLVMRYVKTGYPAHVYVHADMWLAVEVSVANEKFETYEVDEDGRPTAAQVLKMQAQGKTLAQIEDIFDLEAGDASRIIAEGSSTYTRREDDGRTLNEQQQAGEVWDALENKGVKPVTVDGAQVDPTEELTRLIAQHEQAQRSERAKKAREARRSDTGQDEEGSDDRAFNGDED
ncbi:hypothetical protein AB0F36_07935 [Streptomyces sp. NPDC029080]|uniref:hypothetical protein n=1 Tax=Streptomyces sp. NPDC029080 TaxID=3155017 RepID=UPI0033F5911F